ncbi:MAG: hypothetical protein J1F11_05770 [Oscillospiraceae bacterium]|nr:hypothetical protein [Oscillospiraceae bacterium]
MPITDVSMLREKRKKKKLMNFLKKFGVFLAIAAVVLIIVLTRGLWYPKMEGILTKIPVPENSSELAEGNFPISIEGGASYLLVPMDNSLAVADDSHFFVYSDDGKLILSDQHTFSNPIVTAGGKKALLYDLGGKSFALYSKYKNIYSKSTDEPILIARLGTNDTAAVVTKSDKYPSTLMVYDATGKNIFNYRSVSRIIDVTFNADCSGCYITTIGVTGGFIVSKILYYRFDRIDYDASGSPVPVWETNSVETLALSVRLFGEDNLILFGDTMCVYYDLNGNFIKSYEYKRRLVGYSSDGSTAAMVFRNDERRSSVLTVIDCTTGIITEKNLGYEILNVQVSGNTVYMQSRNGIESCTADGVNISSVALDTDYDSFCRMGGYIYLLGYDEINRITYN